MAGLYREAIVPRNSGEPNANITYRAYGDGEVIIRPTRFPFHLPAERRLEYLRFIALTLDGSAIADRGVSYGFLQDFNILNQEIEKAVQDFGDKGTNTDGLCADNQGLIYYTMLEGQRMGIYNPTEAKFEALMSDERMIWVDGMTFDNQGYLIFNNNRLHELFRNELDWDNPYNLVVWKAYLGEGIKSYMHSNE